MSKPVGRWRPDWELVRANMAERRRALATLLEAPPPVRLSDWMDQHFRIKGRAWKTWPVQRVMFDLMCLDAVQVLTVQKSKRVGYTSGLVGGALMDIVHRNRDTAIWQPVDNDANEFFKDEIKPRLREIEIVRDAMRGDPEGKSAYVTMDRVEFFGDRKLYTRGGNSGKSYRRISIDTARFDELSAFPPNVDNEGSPPKLGDGRTEQSPFPKSIRGSTPRLKAEDLIEQSLGEADMVLRRHLPCPHSGCGELHPLEWEWLRWDRENPSESAHFLCPHCGGRYGYEHFSRMDREGRWVANETHPDGTPAPLAGAWVDDATLALHTADDEPLRWPRHVGIFIWAAYSYLRPWGSIAAEHHAANETLKQTGDNTPLITFTNTTKAETWHEGAGQLTAEQLFDRRETYPADVHESALVLTMGVDTQPDRLEYEVLGAGPHFDRSGVEYGVILGDPDEADVWEKLDEVRRNKRWKHPSGDEMRVVATAVDSGGSNTQAVYEYCRTRSAERVYAVRGQGGRGVPIVRQPGKVKMRTGHVLPVYSIGVDGLKQRLLGSREGQGLIHRTAGERGYQRIPMSYSLTWCRGLLSEVYRRTFSRGKWSESWVAIVRRNEPLDVRNYAEAALEILNPLWSALQARADDKATDEEAPKAEEKRKPAGKRSPARGRRGGFTHNW